MTRLLVLFVLAATFAQPALPQDAAAIVVVDQERLFEDSVLGQTIAEELEERSSALAAENRAIESELIAEERALTELRPELEPDEFRALADAFDDKVESLRAEQDAKGRELVAHRDAERQRFTRTVAPLLLDFMRDSGAAVMLDRRSVVATADRVDVTDEMIALIDDNVGADAPADVATGDTGATDQPEGAGAAPGDALE